MLELGSGPGWDGDYLESRGVRVLRTAAARAFVRMLCADGHSARAALPGVSDATIRLALDEVRRSGRVQVDGPGRGATWTRLPSS